MHCCAACAHCLYTICTLHAQRVQIVALHASLTAAAAAPSSAHVGTCLPDLLHTYHKSAADTGFLSCFHQFKMMSMLCIKVSLLFCSSFAGILSRGALLTFAVRGWKSPVSTLSRVRLAVSSKLLRLPIPFSRELLLACGCIPADKSTLVKHLTSGSSIAVAPGGWTEPTHTGSYDVLLKSRFGFVRLAIETGAALVPVLCLGEHLVEAAPDLRGTPGFYTPFVNWVMTRLLNSNKPRNPVRVVFGEALQPEDSDSVKQLHARYVAALMQLAKQHNVVLNLL